MKKDSTSYTLFFALMVCVVCSFILAAVSEGLRPKKEVNVAMDIKKNILKAVTLKDPIDAKAGAQEVLGVYSDKIEEIVINEQGELIPDKLPADIKEDEELYPVYIYKEGGEVLAYCFPIIGKGLWSTLYGYFALEPDAVTVRGITYYKHGETPGLGAEIEKDWFQDNFKGKKVWDVDASELIPTSVVKGKVADVIRDEEKSQYYVDGISGATMTSKGVTEMVDRELRKYEPYFKKKRSI